MEFANKSKYLTTGCNRLEKTEFLIIGGGIIGLAVAVAIKRRKQDAEVFVIEKEAEVAAHASGRNSGVLHAGFYYTADSLKARFTIEGNRALRAYCKERNLALNECGKLVVARGQSELEPLFELERRGQKNGSEVSIVDETQASQIEPNVKTYQQALWSPHTATVDPKAICLSLRADLERLGVRFVFNCPYEGHHGDTYRAGGREFSAKKFINCAGLYADRIAADFGFSRHYTIVPFKGLYLKYKKNKTDVSTNIYPVPDLRNPFLGVHFTKTVDGLIKIGPTAIPCFWREQYDFRHAFSLRELVEIMSWEARLFLTNAFNFRELALEEIRRYQRSHFIKQAQALVKELDIHGFGEYSNPGIRAQLLDKRNLKLVPDFVVEGDSRSVHVLNAVSPAFTCSLPFGEYVVEKYL